MSENDLINVADKANMIVNGYAFTKKDEAVSVLNLNHPESAMVLSVAGVILETNMSPVEQQIVLDIWSTDSEFMEVKSA